MAAWPLATKSPRKAPSGPLARAAVPSEAGQGVPATQPVSPRPARSFLVGDDGRVYEGVGWTVQGTHTPGYSNTSLGLAFFGSANGKVRRDPRPARCLPCLA